MFGIIGGPIETEGGGWGQQLTGRKRSVDVRPAGTVRCSEGQMTPEWCGVVWGGTGAGEGEGGGSEGRGVG